jgi:spore maturation protein CgeB
MVIRSNPGLRPVALVKDYDLFIAHCQTIRELLYLNGVQGWKDRARRSVCYLAELYASEVRQSKNLLKTLRDFDFVFTELRESAPLIADTIGKPCVCLPPAVDAIRFAPYPNAQQRVVDVYSIGRRREPIHQELIKASRSNEIFYLYDTLAGGAGSRVRDYRAHRDLVASITKRSLCFVVAPAKWDEPQQTRGQVAIANRYFEGAAAGAVLVGQPSDSDEFRELFDWQDIVVPLAEDGSDVMSVVRALKADPARSSEIGRRNAANTLLRHDWSARWRQMLEITGTPVGPAMRARESRLQSLASALVVD